MNKYLRIELVNQRGKCQIFQERINSHRQRDRTVQTGFRDKKLTSSIALEVGLQRPLRFRLRVSCEKQGAMEGF